MLAPGSTADALEEDEGLRVSKSHLYGVAVESRLWAKVTDAGERRTWL